MFGFFQSNITKRHLSEIGFVRQFGFFVPLARKHAFPTQVLHGDAEAPDTCKQVDKGKFGFQGRLKVEGWTVLRFWSNDVVKNAGCHAEKVKEIIQTRRIDLQKQD